MNIITVGREFGSGGREIGKRLAEELGFAYYDHEIISEIAARTSLSEDYVQSIVEHRPYFSYPIHTARTLYVQSDPVLDQNIDIYSKQHSLIKELAEKSDCVIVGRCADYILRDQHPIRLFVYADDATKIKRCQEKEAQMVKRRLIRQRFREVFPAHLISLLLTRNGRSASAVSIRKGQSTMSSTRARSGVQERIMICL